MSPGRTKKRPVKIQIDLRLQWRLVRRRHDRTSTILLRSQRQWQKTSAQLPSDDRLYGSVADVVPRFASWAGNCLITADEDECGPRSAIRSHSQAFTTATGTAAAWTMQHGTLIARSVAFLSCLAVPPCMSMCTESLDLTSWRAPLLWSPPMQSSHFPNRRVKYSRGIAERFIRKLQGTRKETQKGHSAHSGRPFEREAQTSCLEARNYMKKITRTVLIYY